MDTIKIGNGILDQIKGDFYYTGILNKEEVFNFYIDLMGDFYKKYPYAVKWDYKKFIKEILDYETI